MYHVGLKAKYSKTIRPYTFPTLILAEKFAEMWQRIIQEIWIIKDDEILSYYRKGKRVL